MTKQLNIGSSSTHLNDWTNMEYDEDYWVTASKDREALGWGSTINHLATRDMPDVFGDALALPFPDETFVTVRSAHVMEHIPQLKIHQAIGEQFRVLKPGGWARVIVPDLSILIDRWQNQDKYASFWEQTRNDPGLYYDSELKKPYETNDEAFTAIIHLNGHHINSFTYSSLEAIMKRIGFVDIQRCDEDEEGIPDATVIDYSLRLKGRKP